MTDEQAAAEAFHRYPDSERLRAAFIDGVFVYRALQEKNMLSGEPAPLARHPMDQCMRETQSIMQRHHDRCPSCGLDDDEHLERIFSCSNPWHGDDDLRRIRAHARQASTQEDRDVWNSAFKTTLQEFQGRLPVLWSTFIEALDKNLKKNAQPHSRTEPASALTQEVDRG